MSEATRSTEGGEALGEAGRRQPHSKAEHAGLQIESTIPVNDPLEFRNDPATNDDDLEGQEGEYGEGEHAYPEVEDDQTLLPPPDFRPFFTTIDNEAGETYHPMVHYVFADDDQDIVTRAALQTLDDSQSDPSHEVASERYVVVNMGADGREVVSITSLSPDWQALQATIRPAPSWGGDVSEGTDRGLMLTIAGQEVPADDKEKMKRKNADLDDLLKVFDEHLVSLDGVFGTAPADLDT